MIISRTPLRVSLFGGGTDFPHYYLDHGGLTLSTTIDKYVYVVVKERYDDRFRLSYTKTELVDEHYQLKHELIRWAIAMSAPYGGLEIATMADIPGRGSGLGSSSAVTVGALAAMRFLRNWWSSPNELAEDACTIELDKCNKPIGKQDQYICAFGGFRMIRYTLDGVIVRSTAIQTEVLDQLDQNLLLFSTGQLRKAEDILAEVVERNNTKTLHEMKSLTEQALVALSAGDVDKVGDLLGQSWELKQTLGTNITNPEIDNMYYRALAAGALGGKICGAGGGGYLLLYVPKEKQWDVRQTLSDYSELLFNFEPEGVTCKRLF